MRVTIEELSRFVAAPPPRAIPPAIRAARLSRTRLGIGVLLGVVVLAVALPLTERIFPDRIVDDWRLDLGDVAHAVGTVTNVTATGVGASGPEPATIRAIRRFDFDFWTADGDRIEASCFSASLGAAVGGEVDVEYLPDDPRTARAVGTTLSRTPRIGVAVLLFPAFGVALIWLSVRRYRRTRALLRDGQFAIAEVVDVQRVHASIHGRVRERVVLRVEHDGATYDIGHDTHPRDAAIARRRRASGTGIGILFVPDRPEQLLWTDLLVIPAEAAADTDDPPD